MQLWHGRNLLGSWVTTYIFEELQRHCINFFSSCIYIKMYVQFLSCFECECTICEIWHKVSQQSQQVNTCWLPVFTSTEHLQPSIRHILEKRKWGLQYTVHVYIHFCFFAVLRKGHKDQCWQWDLFVKHFSEDLWEPCHCHLTHPGLEASDLWGGTRPTNLKSIHYKTYQAFLFHGIIFLFSNQRLNMIIVNHVYFI